MMGMKLFRPLAALALGVALLAAAPPPVGQPAPGFRLAGVDGKPVTLASARGHKAVLVFYRGYW
jgi:hypothetical protein